MINFVVMELTLNHAKYGVAKRSNGIIYKHQVI